MCVWVSGAAVRSVVSDLQGCSSKEKKGGGYRNEKADGERQNVEYVWVQLSRHVLVWLNRGIPLCCLTWLDFKYFCELHGTFTLRVSVDMTCAMLCVSVDMACVMLCVSVDMACAMLCVSVDMACVMLCVSVDMTCVMLCVSVDMACAMLCVSVDMACVMLCVSVDMTCVMLCVSVDMACVMLCESQAGDTVCFSKPVKQYC